MASSGGDTAFEEAELKLTGSPASLTAMFDALDGSRPRSAKVVSTYFDTPDGRLRRGGFSLRLRRKGRRHELTLKRQGADALRRGEWTVSLDQPVADIARLPPQAPHGEIGAVSPGDLQPCFTTEIDRRRKRLDWPGATVEVALDVGRVVSGDRETPLAELEFELLDGELAAMLRQVRKALGRRRFAIGTRSKADRGFALADDGPPACLKAIDPRLDKADTVDTAITRIVAATARQIIGNVAAAADGRDPEGVHQLRIGLRRLRSAFGLFNGSLSRRANGLDGAAKRAFQALAEARDLDVFLLETMAPVISNKSDGEGVERLAGIAEARRQAAHQTTRRLTGERWFNGLLLDLLIAGEGDGAGLVAHDGDKLLLPIAVKVLHKRHKKVLKLGRDFAKLSPKERHQVRIALKKLRYACENFQPLFRKSAVRAYMKRLTSFLDDLGRLNDAIVSGALADQLADGDTDAAMGAALVKGWYGHRLHSVEPHMLKAWRRFEEARPFW